MDALAGLKMPTTVDRGLFLDRVVLMNRIRVFELIIVLGHTGLHVLVALFLLVYVLFHLFVLSLESQDVVNRFLLLQPLQQNKILVVDLALPNTHGSIEAHL